MDVLSSIGWWQVAGLLFGSIYIIAAAKEYQQCWIYGLFSAMCIVVVDFTETLLYIDGILHILYAALAVLGIWLWKQGKSKKKVMKISRISYKGYFGYLLLSVIISVGAGYLLTTQTPANYPYVDAFASTLALFSTFLVIYRVLDVWSYWIIVNLISIYLYFMTGAPCLSLLYVGYLISNINKWRAWDKEWKEHRRSKLKAT